MIILDTNIVSEGLRPQPSRNVLIWLDSIPADELFLCTPVLAELQYGAHLLPLGIRRTKLEKAISDLMIAFTDRIFPFDVRAAIEYGRFVARRDSLGRATGTMDGLIAGIAKANNAAIATRDLQGFDHAEVELIDPFKFSPDT